MSWRRRLAASKDETHDEIVRDLREHGATVLELHGQGDGWPDVLVGYNGVDCMLEIKTPGWRTRSMGKLKARVHARQALVRAAWRGHPITLVESVAEARAAVGIAA